MNWSLERKIQVGFATSLAILGIVAVLDVRSLVKQGEATSEVANTRQALLKLNETMVGLLETESGLRGYIITGEERYLDSYLSGMASVDGNFKRLNDLANHSPNQQRRVASLHAAVDRKLTHLAMTLEMRNARGFEAVQERLRAGNAKELMDEVRRSVAEIEREEDTLLTRQIQTREDARRLTIWLNAGFILLVATVLGASYLLIARDIAARKRAQDTLDRFFSLSLDLLCIAGLDGNFKRLNPAWEKTLGYTAQELLAKPWLDFVHPEDRQATIEVADGLRSGVESMNFENRYRCKDGSYRVLLWCASPSLEEESIYAAARDITHRKQAEEEIRELNDTLARRVIDLNALNHELEAFTYSVSHDLRAPLRHIDGFSKLLLEEHGAGLPDEARRYLTRIREGTRLMGQLVDDLLNLARVGRKELNIKMTGLNSLVEEVMQGLRPELSNREVEWKVGQLPFVECDPGLLKQVFANLLSNAVKFTRPRAQGFIEVGAVGRDGTSTLFVRDNGVGFSMKYADKLFGVFQRLHRQEEFEGTGIGLATVQRIIHKHGGRVWAEADLDKGATFFFTLGSQPEVEPANQPGEGG